HRARGRAPRNGRNVVSASDAGELRSPKSIAGGAEPSQGSAVNVPRLSLCMIVRDEADLLPRFLEQAQGLWDELCVVDTGSSDSTVDILTKAGARIFHRAWDEDFAAARNAGLVWAR